MIRGTTPTLTFTLPVPVSELTKFDLSFAQAGTVLFSKSLADCTTSGNVVTLQLTESETLQFSSCVGSVDIQMRVGSGTTRLASNIMSVPVERILKDGAL